MNVDNIMASLITWAILIIAYNAPSIVAFSRDRHSKWGVFWVNFALGWTFVGWVAALAWAASGAVEPKEPLFVSTKQQTGI